MPRHLLILPALLGLIVLHGLGGAQGKGAKTDKDKLQGTWVAVTAENMGKKFDVPKDQAVTFTFKGDKLTVKEPAKKADEGSFKIDDKKKPKEIDLTGPSSSNPKETETIKAIYVVDDTSLKLVFPAMGPKGDRPTGFEAKDAMIITLKKQ